MMGSATHFSVPLYGLSSGLHQFQYECDEQLLTQYQNVDIATAQMSFDIDLYKGDGFVEITVQLEGHGEAPCGVCLEPLRLPLAGKHTFHVKYGIGEDDDECIYVDHEAPTLDLTDALYQLARLSVPLVWKINEDEPLHDDIAHECTLDMIDRLDEGIEEESSEGPSIWDTIRDQLKE